MIILIVQVIIMLLTVMAEPISLLLLALCNFLFLQFLYKIIVKIKYLPMKCHSRFKFHRIFEYIYMQHKRSALQTKEQE